MSLRLRKTRMTPLIRDLRRSGSSKRALLRSAQSFRHSIAFVLLLTAVGASATVPAPLQSPDNPPAQPAPAPAAQQSAAASSNPSPAPSNGSTPLQKAVQQKKVITEEDLAKPSKPIDLSDLDGEENNLVCDFSCEAELRAQMGFGPEREAEFQNQLTLARHEIGDDKVWNSYLQDALQAASGYCDIQRRVAKIVGKGVVPEYVRNDVHSRFAEHERKLILQYRNSSGLMTQRLQAVQRFAPFRATIMQHEVNEATARVCPDYPLP